MNIEESIIDTTEIRQVNDGLRFRYDLAKNMLKPVTPKKSGLFSCKGREADEIKIYYDGSRRRSGVFYPNGVAGNYRYEAGKQSRIRELSYTRGSDVISSFKYTHDLNDFVTQVDTVRSGITVNPTQTYTYDKRNQLTSATRPMGTGSETFTYDSTGNRLQRDGETTDSTFDDVNRLLSDKKFTYEYDNNGNMTKKTGTDTGEVAQFAWDHRNRLVGVVVKPGESVNPTSTISYKYDAFNRRIEKNVNGTITRYVYDRGNIHLEYDGNNKFQAKYVHSDNVDEAVMMNRPDNPYRNAKFPVQEFYYHRDRLGNITEITDFEGTVVQRYVYDAFGKVSIFDKDGNAITPSSANYLKSPYAFTGQEYDHETGMFLHGVRFYDPDSGRFISEEPLGLDGPNLYWYTLNNPINYVDPTGLATQEYGFSVNVTFLGVAATASLKFAFDDRGNYGATRSFGLGGTGSNTAFSASALGETTITDAETICDLAGVSTQVGGSLGVGSGVVGYEYVHAKNYTGHTFAGGLGVRTPFKIPVGGITGGFHAIPTRTYVEVLSDGR